MYYMYLSEERGSNGQNVVCSSGLSVRMTPFGTTRNFFGTTMLLASPLAQGRLGRQPVNLARVGWGKS
jgi:hypothetical protein